MIIIRLSEQFKYFFKLFFQMSHQNTTFVPLQMCLCANSLADTMQSLDEAIWPIENRLGLHADNSFLNLVSDQFM